MSAKKLADALLFDQASEDLLAAALWLERDHAMRRRPLSGFALLHPMRALVEYIRVDATLPEWHPARARYSEACDRLVAANGYDNSDLTGEEAIDALVAAAFWHLP